MLLSVTFTFSSESPETLVFNINNTNIKWSTLFATLEYMKDNFNIEYSVLEISLEQVYTTMMKQDYQDNLVKNLSSISHENLIPTKFNLKFLNKILWFRR